MNCDKCGKPAMFLSGKILSGEVFCDLCRYGENRTQVFILPKADELKEDGS